MALELDERQRAMLQEMGVRVWLPGTAFALAPDANTASAQALVAERRALPVGAAAPSPVVAQQGARPLPPAAAKPRPVSAVPIAAPVAGAGAPDVGAFDWTELIEAAAACRACGLCAGRKKATLQAPTTALGWQGRAHWMVVGDPPDEDEDAAGSPFADASGALLTNMLKAIQLVRINDGINPNGDTNRDAVSPQNAAYVTNVVKCRAPHGAVPQAADLAQCAAYLQREIALVRPKVILAMGRFANQLLLSETPEQVNLPLGKLRGAVYRYQGVAVVVTYHPRTLMRNSADKAKAWADLCLAADTVDAIAS
jgi:DNA polymerase